MSPFIDDLLAVQFQEQGAKKLQPKSCDSYDFNYINS